MASRIPKHLKCTADEWRALKRREMAAVLKAMKRFRGGVAYTPDEVYRSFDTMYSLAHFMARALEGRWKAWGKDPRVLRGLWGRPSLRRRSARRRARGK